MKKNLLLIAAMFASVAASAQTVVWPCTFSRGEGGVANVAATIEGSETLQGTDITLGSDIKINEATVAIKDATGANYNFPDDTYSMIGFQPITGNAKDDDGNYTNDESTADAAETAGAYIEFTLEETDLTKDLTGVTSVEFDVAKVGTDAVRTNIKLLAEGDANVESEWLIDAEVAKTFGDEYDGANDTKDPWDEKANGYNPSRNDGSKGAAGGANATGVSHVKVSVPDAVKEANPYILTLRVALIAVANNKSLAITNVKFNFGDDTTGISTIKSEKANNNVIYNVAGQQVDNNYKGLVIKNGKKMIQ